MTKEKMIAPKNVTSLYDITGITRLAGIQDYTDGIYNGNPLTPHDVAQKRQHEYLLNELGAYEGFRLLDVGCGLGTLLETARDRGVISVGITISEDQVSQCKAKGLDVRLLNYKDLPKEFNDSFDGIVANGSLEHFCQPEDAMTGKQNEVYENMFDIFAKVLDPDSDYQRVVTTAIHFNGNHIDPRKLLRNPFLQLFDAEGFHSSILHRGYGGYYPIKHQLEKCAKDNFNLIKEVDGTDDYRLTSLYWYKKYRKALFTNPKFIIALLKYFFKRPAHTLYTVASYIGPKSWMWQFKEENPPVKLYRHTWQRSKNS